MKITETALGKFSISKTRPRRAGAGPKVAQPSRAYPMSLTDRVQIFSTNTLTLESAFCT